MKNDDLLKKDDLEKFGKRFEKILENKLETKLETKLEAKLETKLDSKLDFKFGVFRDEINDNLSKWKDEIFNLVDGLALEIRDSREHRVITSHQIVEHGKRIENLEKKVFGSSVNAA